MNPEERRRENVKRILDALSDEEKELMAERLRILSEASVLSETRSFEKSDGR